MRHRKTLEAVDYNTLVDYDETIGTWETGASVTTIQPASLFTVQVNLGQDGVTCWQAWSDNPFSFSYTDTITLPTLGSTLTVMGNEGFVDQTFVDTTTTHEDWHWSYADALLESTYGALEDWSTDYSSSFFATQAEALAAGNADLAAALAVAVDTFAGELYSQDNMGHDGIAEATILPVEGVDTWRSILPDWGGPAVEYAEGIEVEFEISAGDPNCVIPGDGNGDGWVNGIDFLLWAFQFGTHPGMDEDISDGDYDNDGWVDGLDYLVWAGNYGTHVQYLISTPVPEPTSGLLLVVGTLALTLRRRTKHQP